jgi:RecG-like helicase
VAVIVDADGKAYTVRYEAVNAMLLNEFLKEHRKVEEQQATIAQLKAADAKQEEKISALTTELVKAQATQIQKVSARLATIQPVTRLVSNE